MASHCHNSTEVLRRRDEDDVGSYLRATAASYTDGEGEKRESRSGGFGQTGADGRTTLTQPPCSRIRTLTLTGDVRPPRQGRYTRTQRRAMPLATRLQPRTLARTAGRRYCSTRWAVTDAGSFDLSTGRRARSVIGADADAGLREPAIPTTNNMYVVTVTATDPSGLMNDTASHRDHRGQET